MIRTGIQGKKVYVGLSGGVDSSVSAKRLIDAGYDVTGVFIKTWQPDFIPCTWEAERLDAMRVASTLNIPFLTCDAESAYRTSVAEYMITEYQKGRTPNPDVMCNRYVKFGVFLDFARAHGASYVATGHYARVTEHNGAYRLLRGKDVEKDQSYFLWTLTQEELAHTLFPIGDTKKSDVRKEALQAGLITSDKKDSQGICFLGQVDMKDFLSHYTKSEPGVVIDTHGNHIGTHDGSLFYTRGQRHGFTIHNADDQRNAVYVVDKDLTKNTLTVDTQPLYCKNTVCVLEQPNIISHEIPTTCHAQFRYRQQPFRVEISHIDGTYRVRVIDNHIEMPAEGQSCVLYDGDVCIGGGIIGKIYSE